jgi:hypothetical protein
MLSHQLEISLPPTDMYLFRSVSLTYRAIRWWRNPQSQVRPVTRRCLLLTFQSIAANVTGDSKMRRAPVMPMKSSDIV